MKMRKRIGLFLMAVCLAAASFSGCGVPGASPSGTSSESKKDSAANEDTKSAGRNPNGTYWVEDDLMNEYTEEERDQIKYHYYLNFNNELLKVLDNIETYYKVVKREEEFSLVDGMNYGYLCDSLRGFDEELYENILYLADWTPAYEGMDDVAKSMQEPLLIFTQNCKKIRNGRRNYSDDQYALAKEWHAVMWQYSDEVYNQGRSFMRAFDKLADAQRAVDEQRLLEEGRLIQYYTSRLITLSDRVLDICDEQGIWDENLSELDLTEIKRLYQEMCDIAAAYDEAVADSDQIIKESLSNNAPFNKMTDLLCWSVESMIHASEQGVNYTEGNTGAGTLTFVNDTCRRFVERYNNVFSD